MSESHVSEIERHDGLTIPVQGETVAATRYEPVGSSGPDPVLLMYYPYRKDDHLTFGAYSPFIEYLAAHGYNVVTADIVGTGASSGWKETPADSSVEGEEGAEIVEWLADREWSSGRVGMFGKSYAGLTCLSTAAEQPRGLDAIAPMYSSTGGYRESGGGVFDPMSWGGSWHPLMQALQGMPPSYRDEDGRWAAVWKEHLNHLENGEPWLFQELDHETRDEFWTKKSVDVEAIDVPTFGVTGWRDYAPAETVEYISKIDAPKRAVLGPWRHTMGHRGRETAIDLRRQTVEWFDHFLKDESNDARSHATIEFWTERNGGGRVGEGAWRTLDTWPEIRDGGETTETDHLSFACTPDGLVDADDFDSGTVETEYEHDHTVGMRSVYYGFPVPADTGPDDARSLCFETDPVSDPVELTGTGTVTVRVRSTIPDPILVARVVDVGPDGRSMLVNHGRLRLSHRNGHDDPEDLVPGEEYEVSVPLSPKSHVFERGHRIRLALSSAHFPYTLPTRRQGAYTFLSSPDHMSTLEFPGTVHDGEVRFENPTEMAPPDDDVHAVHPSYVTPEPTSWSTSRDHIHDTATVQKSSGKRVDLPHGGEMELTSEAAASVAARNPKSMHVEAETRMTIDYGTEVATALVTCRVSRESAQYTTTIELDGQTVMDETFSW
jgi:putative CocE/NonD family hydrolase